MNFYKKIIGEYTNQNNEDMFLWEFWTTKERHIFNVLLIGDKPNKKSGGFYCLEELQRIKGNGIKMFKDEMKGGIK